MYLVEQLACPVLNQLPLQLVVKIDPETIALTRGKELPGGTFKRIAKRTAGLFVFIDVPDLGLTIQWDRGNIFKV